MTEVVTGYTLALPEGWVRIPLGDEQSARAIVADLAGRAASGADLPPDERPKVRASVQGRLQAAVQEARAAGGLDLYVPTAPLAGLLLPVSLVVAEPLAATLPEEAQAAPDPVAVLALLLARTPNSSAVELDRAPGMRTEGPTSRAPGQHGPDGTRVEHVLAVPGAPGRWLSLTATVLAVDDAEIAALLLDLVDAVLTTFRWSRAAA